MKQRRLLKGDVAYSRRQACEKGSMDHMPAREALRASGGHAIWIEGNVVDSVLQVNSRARLSSWPETLARAGVQRASESVSLLL